MPRRCPTRPECLVVTARTRPPAPKQRAARGSHAGVTGGATVEAVEAVYRARGRDFYRYALATTNDPELARDAVQEGFARALRARRGYRGNGVLDAWIAEALGIRVGTVSAMLHAARERLGRLLEEVVQ